MTRLCNKWIVNALYQNDIRQCRKEFMLLNKYLYIAQAQKQGFLELINVKITSDKNITNVEI